MWNFHRLLKQAGFEHAQTSPEQFLAELGEMKGAMNPKHYEDLKNAHVQGQVWRVHRYRLNEWSSNVETLNEHQREDMIQTAFEGFKKKYKDRPEIQNTVYIRYLPQMGGKKPAVRHEYIVLERKPGILERISRWLAIGKWS